MKASLEYVRKLQEVQERKKFEFVETILSFMYQWMNFYHQGHEVAKDFKKFMTDLQIILQRTRDNYESTQNETDNLMKKMLEDKPSRSFVSFLCSPLLHRACIEREWTLSLNFHFSSFRKVTIPVPRTKCTPDRATCT